MRIYNSSTNSNRSDSLQQNFKQVYPIETWDKMKGTHVKSWCQLPTLDLFKKYLLRDMNIHKFKSENPFE